MKKYLLSILFICSSLPLWIHAQVPIGLPIKGAFATDSLGFCVVINGDGSRIAASTNPGPLIQGMPYIRVYDQVLGNWVQAGSDLPGFGTLTYPYSMDMSDDGNWLVVGDPNAIIPMNFGGGDVNVFFWTGIDWIPRGAPNTVADYWDYGADVAISGDGTRVAVGDPSGALTITSNGPGYVVVFEWNGMGWWEVGNKLSGSIGGEQFGTAVALSEDGNRLIVGAGGLYNFNNAGYAKAFEWDGSQWVQMGATIDPGPFGNCFGKEVSMNAAGNRIAISSPNYNPNNLPLNAVKGGVIVLDWDGNQWNQVGNIIEGALSMGVTAPQIDLSAFGDRLAIGGKRASSQKGMAVLYEFKNNQWEPVGTPILGSSAYQHTGKSIALSNAGDILAVGSPRAALLPNGSPDSYGHVRVFGYNKKVVKVIVKQDQNNDCLGGNTEPGVENIPLTFTLGNQSITNYTNGAGELDIVLNSVTYDVSLNLASHPYFTACTLSQQIVLDTSTVDTTVVEFVLQKTLDCPHLTAEIFAPFIRRCFPGYYSIKFCNNGTSLAQNAYLELDLDPELTFTTGSFPLIAQNGNLLTFALGDILPGACSTLRVDFHENCQSILGQVHCSAVHIFPDSVCSGGFTRGAIKGKCQGDTLQFIIKDVAQNLPVALPYHVVTGASVADSGFLNFMVNAQDTLAYPTATYSEPYQLIMAPGNADYHTVTGLFTCQNLGTNALLHTPTSPFEFEDTDCQPNIGSYDPNDKQATPVGTGPEHQIAPGSLLEYLIRFQNTGTDTAFFVNILDTLPEQVVPSSLRVRAASHTYTQFEDSLPNGRTVYRFSFDPILLPDSATDLAMSQGYIKFAIQMKDSLPIGTKIENTASIYFDYNLPIKTNRTLQTLFLPGDRCSQEEVVHVVSACAPYTWIDGNIYFGQTDTTTFSYSDSTECLKKFRLDFTPVPVDTGVVKSELGLASRALNATFQWIDCQTNLPILGASQNFFIPPASGEYAVIVNQNGCEDTSRCVAFEKEPLSIDPFSNVRLYPNPSQGACVLDLGGTYVDVRLELMDVMGKSIWSAEEALLTDKRIQLPTEKGIYLLKVQIGSKGEKVWKVFRD
ncbi:MAG: T9SS type A sorting domain-containing protein [Bacteroidota bacterium]